MMEITRISADELHWKVAVLWKELLALPEEGDIDPYSDFFLEGGDSLLASTLMADLSNEIGIELELGLVYRHPIFARFVDSVRSRLTQTSDRQVIPDRTSATPTGSAYSCLGGQREVLTRYSGRPEMNSGLKLIHFVCHGSDGRRRAEHVLKTLMARHDGLRILFNRIGDSIVCLPPSAVMQVENGLIELPELSQDGNLAEAMANAIREHLVDLLADPWGKQLFHVAFRQTSSDIFHCILVLHHALADQIGLATMRRDALYILGQVDTPPACATSSFIEFLGQHDVRLKSAALPRARAFWQKAATHHSAAIDLIAAKPRIIDGTTGTAISIAEFPRRQVDAHSKKTGFLPVLIFLNSFSTALRKHHGEVNCPAFVGLALTARNRVQLSNCVGYFNQLIPFPIQYATMLDERMIEAFAATMEHAWIGPFEIRGAMGLDDLDEIAHPIFDCVLNFADTSRAATTLAPQEDQLSEIAHFTDDTLHRLVLHVDVDPKTYKLRLKYNTHLVTDSAIADLKSELMQALAVVLKHA